MLDTRRQGAELLIQFKSGLRVWVPARRVTMEQWPSDQVAEWPSETTRPPDHLATGPLPSVEPLGEIQARRMIEAFRLGIVPHQDVEEFTFGRDEEIAAARQGLERLKQGTGGTLLIEGEYGTGKTHLLEYVHHEALKMGMAVSRVEFDPAEVAPNRPKRVYRELVHNLRWIGANPESPVSSPEPAAPSFVEYGFRDLLMKARDLSMEDHVFFAPVLARLKRAVKPKGRGRSADLMQEVFWQMIEGESTKEYAVQYRSPYRIKGGYSIPALYDFSTAGDFYCYILSGLSHICRELNLFGLVILLDEAETVTHLWDIIAFARGVNFIEGLIRTAQDDPELKKVDSKLIHNRVRTTPYIYRQPYIYLAIATTPEPYDYTYLKMTNYARSRLVLPPLRNQALDNAFDRLVTVYQHAYPEFKLAETDEKRLRDYAFRRRGEGVRYFVKLCVEALDLARVNQHGIDFRKVRA